MQYIAQMKGQPSGVMTLLGRDKKIDLVRYPDGSFGILLDGNLQSVWEPDEEYDCVIAFGRLSGLHDGRSKVITRIPGGPMMLTEGPAEGPAASLN